MVKHCLMYWNGKEAEGGGDFTLVPGIRPSSAVLRFRMEYTHDQFGTLTITDGQQTRHFRECRLERLVTQQVNDGKRWREATILDQRWQWEENYSAVYGEFNAEGKAIEIQKSARDMAEQCVLALGVPNYNVQALPDDLPGPYAFWDGMNPAVALQEICEQYGCIITLDTNDAVVIHKRGVGQKPRRDDRVMDFQLDGSPPVIPRYIVVEGGHTLIQHDYPLVAVAEETQGDNAGRYLPINDLSYKPPGGWEKEVPGQMGGVVDPADRRVAIRDIYKVFIVGGRVQWIGSAFFGPIDEWRDIPLPVPPAALHWRTRAGRPVEQDVPTIEYFTVTEGNAWRIAVTDVQVSALAQRPPAKVVGFYYQKGHGNRNTLGVRSMVDMNLELVSRNGGWRDGTDAFDFRLPFSNPTDTHFDVQGNFQVFPNVNMVKMQNYTYLMINGDYTPPVIRLRCGARFRDPDTGGFICAQYWTKTGGPISANITKMIKASDIGIGYYLGFQGFGSEVRVPNRVVFLQQSIRRVAKETSQYEYPQGASIPFKGFVFDYPPDGIVRAVSFSKAPSGEGRSFVDFGLERPDNYLTFRERLQARLVTFNQWLALETTRKKARGIGPRP